jgi:GGDEF domain-containing protein
LILADTSPAGAHNVVERTEAYVADWNKAGHLERFELSMSIGVAEWVDGKTLDEVLDSADRHMYAHKNQTASPGNAQKAFSATASS